MSMLFRDDNAEECTHCQKIEALADVKEVRVCNLLGPNRFKKEQLHYLDIGLFLKKIRDRTAPRIETHRRPEPQYKICWADCKSLSKRNGINRRTKKYPRKFYL
jgi:hypothetical protein